MNEELLERLSKVHGQYKITQLLRLEKIYNIINKPINLEEMAKISRKELNVIKRQAYSMMKDKGYKIPI